MMNKVRFFMRLSVFGFFMALSAILFAQPKDETTEIKKIWDRGGHNAFTDITFFRHKQKLFVVFRAGDGHIPNKDNTGNGKIRVLSSLD